jgi:hypothetical protein
MKFWTLKIGQIGLLLSLAVLGSGCNPDEYFPSEEFASGADAYCSRTKDAYTCQQLASFCRPAYLDPHEYDYEEPVFTACIANPDLIHTPEGGDEDTSSGGGGSSDPIVPPTIDEAIRAKCDLHPRYLHEVLTKKKGKVVSIDRKIKICHRTGNGSSHSIIVACPALKAHRNHGDIVGACPL